VEFCYSRVVPRAKARSIGNAGLKEEQSVCQQGMEGGKSEQEDVL